ncbi:hypothetical protein AHF37_07643, partial [Paragonimus kellicotti]
ISATSRNGYSLDFQRCQADEIARLQSALEDVSSRLIVSQKRVEEREMRLRKLENENHDLLDEIHVLRKGNTELESQVDSLRQRLLDRQERPGSTAPTGSITSPTGRVQQQMSFGGSFSMVNQELERVRKQHAELSNSYEQTQKQLEELQIQYDQLTVQRNNLRTQLEEEIGKRATLEEKLRSSEDQRKAHLLQAIICLNREIERLQAPSSIRDRIPDSTSQQILLADLQVRLRQIADERDQAKEQLAVALSHAESSYLETQQQLLAEKVSLK